MLDKSNPLPTVESYKKLYENEWLKAVPGGPFVGILANGSSDLTFSMERLSTQPYKIRRLKTGEQLSFTVDDAIVTKLAGMPLKKLRNQGRLFYIDYRDQAPLVLQSGRYAALCEAYFFISTNDQFLPLAIKPNAGSSLVYTPLDSSDDWSLAKMMFNLNDLWWGQWSHLISVHAVIDLVSLASLRTMSTEHPVFGLIGRWSKINFAIRIAALDTLIQPGGPIQQVFAWERLAPVQYSNIVYQNSGIGKWRGNYYLTDLQDRGLLNCKYGPALKNLPYYEDTLPIYNALNSFVTTFVRSYYTNEKQITKDVELQNWAAEAQTAGVLDFPNKFRGYSDLIDCLTHYAYLASVSHGIRNTNEISHSTITLPWHPTALYRPIPTEKGVTDLVTFLPNITQSIAQIALGAAFNRPFLANTNSSLLHMFDDSLRLPRWNSATQQANLQFQNSMQTLSDTIRAKKFDENGLCQGMPFIWNVLDPNTTPFYVTV